MSPYQTIYSRTPDWDLCYFNPCKRILSHIPIPASGQDNKNEQPHVGRNSICDVIVMLKSHHHVASQRIQYFMEIFFMFSNIKWEGIKWWARKRIHYSCEGGIEKSVPGDHILSSLSKPGDANRWSSGRIFQSHTHDGFLYHCCRQPEKEDIRTHWIAVRAMT